MVVCFVIPADIRAYPYYGGEQVHIHLIEALAKKGVHPLVIFPSYSTQSYPKILKNLPITYVPIPLKAIEFADAVKYKELGILAGKANIIHAWTWSSIFGPWELGNYLQNAVDTPCMLSFHSDYSVWQDEQDKIKGVEIIDGATAMTCLNKTSQKIISGQTTTPITTVPNGIPRELIAEKPIDKGDYFLWLGRLDPIKGTMVLAQTLGILKSQRVKIHLKIAGTAGVASFKPGEAALREQGKFHDIEFLGYLSGDEKMDTLAKSRCLLFPSLSEGFGISVIEALAVGTQVIASRANGPTDILENGGGTLIPVNNPTALAKAVIKTLGTPHNINEGTAAIKLAGNYSWETIADRYLKLYEQFGNDRNEIVRSGITRIMDIPDVAKKPVEYQIRVKAHTPIRKDPRRHRKKFR